MTIEEIQGKIMSMDSAIEWRKKLTDKNNRLVMTNGCFDLIHRGHIEYMLAARSKGDKLLIAVNSDKSVQSIKGPDRPLNSEDDRSLVLASMGFIDGIIIFNTPRCDKIIEAIKPDIYAKGADYNIDTIDQTERKALEAAGSEIAFISFVPGYSTTSIIKKMDKSE